MKRLYIILFFLFSCFFVFAEPEPTIEPIAKPTKEPIAAPFADSIAESAPIRLWSADRKDRGQGCERSCGQSLGQANRQDREQGCEQSRRQSLGQGRGRVKLTAYIPQSDTPTTAVIVCPGGSYFWLDVRTEGHEVARWLQSCGIAAFVLEYRTGGKFNFACGTRLLYGGHHFPYMLQDVQKAILTVRNRALLYNIKPESLGVMGFSAGGHLAMMSAVYPHSVYLEQCGEEVTNRLKPNFVAPIYPVVTFTHKRYTHRRSRRGALGEYKMNNTALRDSLSLEKHIPENCCPVFLLNCEDDPIVDYHNSILLDSALTARNIPHIYTRFPVGGHGFGCRTIVSPQGTYDWKPLFMAWLKSLF